MLTGEEETLSTLASRPTMLSEPLYMPNAATPIVQNRRKPHLSPITLLSIQPRLHVRKVVVVDIHIDSDSHLASQLSSPP